MLWYLIHLLFFKLHSRVTLLSLEVVVSYTQNSVVNFIRNHFENNSAFYGGGMAIINNSVGTFAENVFLNNVANSGGGSVNVFSNSTASFLNNTLMKNIAALDGGAVYDDLKARWNSKETHL